MQNSQQLDFSFEGDERLSRSLMQGRFLTLVEFITPLNSRPREESLSLAKKYGQELSSLPEIFAVTVDDRLLGAGSQDPLEYAATLQESSGKPVILTISGCGSSALRAKSLLAEARSRGLRNLFLTTGRLPANAAQEPPDYLDSLEMLTIFQPTAGENQRLHFGCAVNPFQYLPETQVLQYGKMLKKLQAGASFLTAQAGWDMKKSQELQWFLQQHSLAVPVFARICLFPPDNLEGIGANPLGIPVPLAIASQMLQEAKEEPADFLDRQLERLALQIAGYRKLGYAGIQICGARDARVLSSLLDKVRLADARYPDFDSWLQAWNAEMERLNVVPTISPHYLFAQLLQPGCQDYVPNAASAGLAPAASNLRDRFAFRCWRLLASAAFPAWLRKLCLRLFRRPGAELSRLAACAYLNNCSCPKKLVLGPCGDCRWDGSCEQTSSPRNPCFFLKVMRVLADCRQLQALEELPDSSRPRP